MHPHKRLKEIQQLIVSTYPGYLMGKNSYRSPSILGRLYQNALEFTKKCSSSTAKVLKNGVNYNVRGRTCKNEHDLHTHKRTCDKKSIPKFKIIDRLTKNPDGEYNCPNVQCGKTFKPKGITPHVKSCRKEWLKQNGFSID
ncbi:unnamed protein product [Adineta steineri]|uniref:Uncharacterized protein n=1 Tax=Adineta steineri TaxID=433720 RepID=A0A814NJS7_9BILA|nr:unnamed protein product [Adineta steineri]CAF1183709.1 unnamed protein product [Adineta steineri]